MFNSYTNKNNLFLVSYGCLKIEAVVSLFMILFPNAKINIGLNITERRSDGYHNLETIFYPIKINDAIEVIPANELSFESSGLDIPGRMEDNLCVKGYHLLKKDHNLPPVKIHLHKHIPIGAGLGGGSSDAAFFIKLMNEQFNLCLTVAEMQEATFAGGDTMSIAGSYVEFAERSVLPAYNHLKPEEIQSIHRREGFETSNADKIFESTYTGQVKS